MAGRVTPVASEIELCVGFPDEDAERDKLRRWLNIGLLPAKVPDSVVLPCADCGMKLTIGPMVRAKVAEGIRILCVYCMTKEVKGHEHEVRSLDNPNSKLEGWD